MPPEDTTMPSGRPKMPPKDAAFSKEDEERYKNLVSLLHSLTFALTNRFLKEEGSRPKIVDDLARYAALLLDFTGGCSDPQLCYDKERGCYPCSDQAARKV